MSKRIALLGAESTGKTTLAHALAAHLRTQGTNAVAVPEVLREWCEREGRAPRPEEQLAVAHEQERRVDSAAAHVDFVIADTTALMVAIHSGMLFEDGELHRYALARQRAYEATLVTGLDIAWTADGLQRNAPQRREHVDTLVRSLLLKAAVPYQVVYGSGPQRLQSALRALASAGVLPGNMVDPRAPDDASQPWVWVCDKCSDPACEHRLFSRLKSARGQP